MMLDDISSVFHQLFYHLCLMPIFASIFSTYLWIPVGTIFGGCSSQSFYMLLGKLQAWFVGAFNFPKAYMYIKDNTPYPSNPQRQRSSILLWLATIVSTMVLWPCWPMGHYPLSSLVDDTGNANIWSWITQMVTASVLSAYLMFGFPGDDLWANWPSASTKTNGKLSLHTSLLSWDLQLIPEPWQWLMWLFEKCQWLYQQIQDLLCAYCSCGFVPCHGIVQALGLLQNRCYALPLVATMSLQLQHAFSDCVKKPWKTNHHCINNSSSGSHPTFDKNSVFKCYLSMSAM